MTNQEEAARAAEATRRGVAEIQVRNAYQRAFEFKGKRTQAETDEAVAAFQAACEY